MQSFFFRAEDFLTGKEVETDMRVFTGLNIGDRVTHLNAGQHGGSGTRIYSGLGTITGFEYQGQYSWGGHCVTVDVLWDNGETLRMVYSLAVKQSEAS